MKILPSILFPSTVLGLALASLIATATAEVVATKQLMVPDRIRPDVGVISSRWLAHLPPAIRVNHPKLLRKVYPGQKIAVVLVAEGPNRSKLFDGVTVDVHTSSPSLGDVVQRGIKPTATKLIKAEGADMAFYALKAAGVGTSDQAKLKDMTTMVAYGVFQPTWQIPAVIIAETVQISVTVHGTHMPVQCKPAVITIRPTSDWMNEVPPDLKQADHCMNRYYESAAPGHLLGLLKTFAGSGQLDASPAQGFFVAALRDDESARQGAMTQFASLDHRTRFALLHMLRLAGQDISTLEKGMTSQQRAGLQAIRPMQDPRRFASYHEPIDARQIQTNGNQMDLCWGAWMATGDPSYLRALVNLLGYAPDYPACEAWVRTQGGQQGINAAVARGLSYQIAGWSIRSFQRTDPLVFDWLDYWKNEPSFPKQLREQLTALPDNPAFDRR